MIVANFDDHEGQVPVGKKETLHELQTVAGAGGPVMSSAGFAASHFEDVGDIQ